MIDIYTLLTCSAWILTVMLIWFRSDAFQEYVRVFRLDKYFGVKKFAEQQEEDYQLSYHTFLIVNYNSFFIRLITCPVCTLSWASIIVGAAIVGWIYIPFIFLTVLMGFGLINWGWGHE